MSGTALSWVISLGVACGGAVSFVLVGLATGESDGVALVGGAAWVFTLSVIILLPTVMPLVRGRR